MENWLKITLLCFSEPTQLQILFELLRNFVEKLFFSVKTLKGNCSRVGWEKQNIHNNNKQNEVCECLRDSTGREGMT